MSEFKWIGGRRHFVNTACKTVREKHGNSFARLYVKFFYELYDWEEENKDVFCSPGYYMPTGLLISELKRTNNPQDLEQCIDRFRSDLAKDLKIKFQDRCRGGSVKIGSDEMSVSEWWSWMKDDKNRQKCDELTKLLWNQAGVYLLYTRRKKLLYIGKSVNLSNRIYASAARRKASYVRYIMPVAEADIHIIEPFLIAKMKPPLNVENKANGGPSFEIPIPEMSEFIYLKSEQPAAANQ